MSNSAGREIINTGKICTSQLQQTAIKKKEVVAKWDEFKGTDEPKLFAEVAAAVTDANRELLLEVVSPQKLIDTFEFIG